MNLGQVPTTNAHEKPTADIIGSSLKNGFGLSPQKPLPINRLIITPATIGSCFALNKSSGLTEALGPRSTATTLSTELIEANSEGGRRYEEVYTPNDKAVKPKVNVVGDLTDMPGLASGGEYQHYRREISREKRNRKKREDLIYRLSLLTQGRHGALLDMRSAIGEFGRERGAGKDGEAVFTLRSGF